MIVREGGGFFLQAKQQKRQQMLRAAKKLFTELGFEHTSMQKIADEAHVGVATLFRYFPKKELLITEIVIELIEQMLPDFKGISKSNKTGYEKIDAYITYLFSANREAATILENFENYATYNLLEEALIAKIRQAYMQINECITLALEQGQKDGSIPLSTSSQITAHTMINLFGIAVKKHAFTSFMPYEIIPNPTKEQLLDVKKVILNFLVK